MPRIRKKTSKRGTTRQREKIKHKVSEHRKKTKKQARQDKAAGKLVQKKSKKDPGIPNNFPYKDQILAEVAEQRRQAAAEKQRRKEDKKRAAAAAAGDNGENLEGTPEPEDVDVDANDGQGFDGIMSLKSAPIPRNEPNVDAKQERTVSLPVSPGPSTLRQVVEKADIVLHVVDARDPVAGISDALAEAAQGKLTVLLNKADTVPRESLSQWLVYLRASFPVLPFRVSSAFLPRETPFEAPNQKAKGKAKDDALGLGGLWAHFKHAKAKNSEEIIVAVTGLTNAGKSSVINSIVGSDVFSIYNVHTAGPAKGAYTTTSAHEVAVDKDGTRVRLIDTPGLQFVNAGSTTEEEREAIRARDVLLRSRGRIERVKDPLSVVSRIVERAETQDLMLAYGLPAFMRGDVSGFLAALARVNGLIKTRGVVDHAGAARIVLRDWSTGKLMRYSMAGNGSGETTEEDGAVLDVVRSGKELRSAKGIKVVKMVAGERDGRAVEMDGEWDEEEEQEEEEEEEGESRSGRKRKVSFAIGENGKRRR